MMFPWSIALGDIKDDGHIDIVIGNMLFPWSIALGDIKDDGHIDIVIGNWYQSNQTTHQLR